LAEAESLKNII